MSLVETCACALPMPLRVSVKKWPSRAVRSCVASLHLNSRQPIESLPQHYISSMRGWAYERFRHFGWQEAYYAASMQIHYESLADRIARSRVTRLI